MTNQPNQASDDFKGPDAQATEAAKEGSSNPENEGAPGRSGAAGADRINDDPDREDQVMGDEVAGDDPRRG